MYALSAGAITVASMIIMVTVMRTSNDVSAILAELRALRKNLENRS